MDYLKEKLLFETLSFLEFTQKCCLENKISLSQYYNITSIKFDFISSFLTNEGKAVFIGKDLRARIKAIFSNDTIISCKVRKAAGAS